MKNVKFIFQILFLIFIVTSCQTLNYSKAPGSKKLSELKKEAPYKIEIKDFDSEQVRKLLKTFKKILRSKKMLSEDDWKIHDELLDAYISLKYSSGENTVSIPAKSHVIIDASSFCLDPSQASPHIDEPFFLNRKKLFPYQSELLKYAAESSKDKTTVQEIFWNLQNKVQWEEFPEKHQILLKKIDPKAPLVLPSKIKEYFKDKAKNYIQEKYNLPNFERFTSGQFYQYQEFAEAIEGLSSDQRLPENKPYRIEETELYSFSNSDGYHSHELTVFNTTDSTATIDLSNYTLTPLRRDVQPIGVYSSLYKKHALLKDLEVVLFDLMLRTGVGMTPVIGDIVDLYEVIAGKDFFNRTDLSDEDRLLSAWGLMAGSGQVSRMAKKGLSAPKKVVKELGKKYKAFLDPKRAKDARKLIKKIHGKVPDDWPMEPSKFKRGKPSGFIFTDPNNRENTIRVMPGDPKSKYKNQRKPYAVVIYKGKHRRHDGKVAKGKWSGEAHIPLKDFNFSRVFRK